MSENITRKPKPTKIKGIYSCPKQLQQIIELVNLLPLNTIKYTRDKLQAEINRIEQIIGEKEVVDPNYFESKAYDKLCDQLLKEFTKVVIKVIPEPEILQYMFDEEANNLLQDMWFFATNRYLELARTQTIFRTIAKEFEKLENEYTEIYSYELLKYSSLYGYLTVTKAGFIKPNFSEVISIFQNENIYYANIRICEVCEKIFWAKREKSKTCSRVCTNILINREYRKTNKERINENRRLNYQSKKELAKGKKRRK